jgi:hypothetical protein
MRINDRASLGPSAAETGRTPDTQKPGRETAGQTGSTRSAEGDRVELSTALGRLSEAIGAHAAQRADRVRALANDYQNGRYHPDSAATARSLVSEALAAHG